MSKYSLSPRELFGVIPENIEKFFDGKKYAWEVLPEIKNMIEEIISSGDEKYSLLCEGVLVGKNVRIDKTATIIPPAVIGDDVEIRPGAYLRGNVYIGDRCVIGNSSELKNCVLLTHVQVPHYNYVGDSVLGNNSHMGAGAICSNLKSDGKNVVVHADGDIPTGLRKFGAILGDGVDVGCGSVLNPGTVIGKNTQVYPLTMLRGAYPENSIVKSTTEVVEKENRLS